MKNVVIFFVAIICIKIMINSYYFFRVKKLYKIYDDYINKKIDYKKMIGYSEEIIEMFNKVGIEDLEVPVVEMLGMQRIKASVQKNILITRPDVIIQMNKLFFSTLGVFKRRIYESLNPIYWIETIIFLPQRAFSFLGVEKDKLLVRVFQLLWWIIAGFGSFFYSIYKPGLDLLIKNHIQSLLN
jgi:hypothetical protein